MPERITLVSMVVIIFVVVIMTMIMVVLPVVMVFVLMMPMVMMMSGATENRQNYWKKPSSQNFSPPQMKISFNIYYSN